MRGSCIGWLGTINSGGYGTIWVSRKRRMMAHRAIWEGVYGKVPDGKCLDHICRVRSCINIHHLRVVTNRENILCGVGLSAQHAQKTHCDRGHELLGDNLKVRKGKHERVCKTCQRNRNRDYMRRRRSLAQELSR